MVSRRGLAISASIPKPVSGCGFPRRRGVAAVVSTRVVEVIWRRAEQAVSAGDAAFVPMAARSCDRLTPACWRRSR